MSKSARSSPDFSLFVDGVKGACPAALSGPMSSAIDSEMFEAYLRDVAVWLPTVSGSRDLRIVYTAMHGVGGRFVTAALRRFGFGNVQPVARQYNLWPASVTLPRQPGS